MVLLIHLWFISPWKSKIFQKSYVGKARVKSKILNFTILVMYPKTRQQNKLFQYFWTIGKWFSIFDCFLEMDLINWHDARTSLKHAYIQGLVSEIKYYILIIIFKQILA